MQVRVVDLGSEEWDSAASLVKSVYRSFYGASINPCPDRFAVYYNNSNELLACGGMTSGTGKKMFSEAYLSKPAEAELAEAMNCIVNRNDIVEVGSLASSCRKVGSELMVLIPFLAWCQGKRFILCTATSPLTKLLSTLNINFTALSPASIERIPEHERALWGSYYETKPVVGYIDISKMADSILSLTAKYSFKSLDMQLAAQRMVA